MIGSFDVTTTKLPTLRGSALRFKIQRLFTADKTGSLSPERIGMALALLPDADVNQLLLETFVCTTLVADGPNGKLNYGLAKLTDIDFAFDGDIDAMWEAVSYVWEVNFSRPTKGVVVQADPAP